MTYILTMLPSSQTLTHTKGGEGDGDGDGFCPDLIDSGNSRCQSELANHLKFEEVSQVGTNNVTNNGIGI